MVDISRIPEFESRLLLGGKVIEADAEAGVGQVRYTPPEAMLNPNKIIQGGFLAAMVDDAASLVTWISGGKRNFTTLSLNINYLRPAKEGAVILGEARLVHLGRRQAVVETILVDETTGKDLARATQTQLFLTD